MDSVVVLEPVVTLEKLHILLAEAAESEMLDYKEVLDLLSTQDEVELAKDLGAMQVHGGFVVVGADSHGRVTSRLTQAQADLLDEARIRAKMARFIPEPFDLLAAQHEIDGHPLVLIYAGPHRDCFAVFRADGQYRNAAGRDVVRFRQGEVFARHGSASERWRQEDIDEIRRCLTEREKEEWRRELRDDIERIGIGAAGRRIATGSAASFTWQLDASTFQAAAVELLRTSDTIPIRLLLRSAGTDARTLAERGDFDDIKTLLNRISCLGALGLTLKLREIADETFTSLGAAYDVGFRLQANNPAGSARLWLDVLERVYVLGALAVRESDWSAVRSLALRRGEPDDRRQFYRTWVRHGITMAARANLFTRSENDQQVQRSLLSLAHEVARREDCLRPDLAPDDELLLDSICQFDILAALAAISDATSLDARYYYTAFAWFYTNRTEPAIVRLLTDPVLRQAVFPGSDDDLAAALRELDRRARAEAMRIAGWDGFTDERILRFMGNHPDSIQT